MAITDPQRRDTEDCFHDAAVPFTVVFLTALAKHFLDPLSVGEQFLYDNFSLAFQFPWTLDTVFYNIPMEFCHFIFI